jgi:response regulator of citrate/malate metabolism
MVFGPDIIIILDMHIKDISSIQVAKEIVNRNLCQQIIFTTTTIPSDIVRQEISSAGLDNYDVLTKPSNFLSFQLRYSLALSK